MANEVEICRIALGLIGDRASIQSISPPDSSVQANHCATFYPLARDAVLDSDNFEWSFCVRRETLAALTNDVYDWDYKYQIPNKCLRALRVLSYQATDSHVGVPFKLENGAIYTNEDQAALVFIYHETDTAKYAQPVVDAIARRLASYLAGPIVKGDAGRKETTNQYNLYLVSLEKAKSMDANQGHDEPELMPSNIRERGEIYGDEPLILPPNWPGSWR